MRPREIQLICSRHMANEDSEPGFKFQVLPLKSFISINNKCLPNIPSYFSQKLYRTPDQAEDLTEVFCHFSLSKQITVIQRYKKI